MWGNFFPSEKECLGVDVPKEEFTEIADKGKNCLVGRLMFERTIGKKTIRTKLICA
jgi:methanogenic corrinoid protein MtbC1